jgi:hypothetical protein
MSREIALLCEADDMFAHAFAKTALDAGYLCRQVRPDDFSREITLEHDDGEVRIFPDCAIFLRPIKGIGAEVEEEARFCWSESFAALWAAAALTKNPVVNRPNEWGLASRGSQSAIITERRAGLTHHGFESFWHGLQPEGADSMLHQDLIDWRMGIQPENSSFVRSRQMPRCRGWEQVVVAVGQGFRTSTAEIGDRDLIPESIRLAAALHHQFATLTWGIPEDDAPPLLARINPFPTVYECAPVWTSVSHALLEYLSA